MSAFSLCSDLVRTADSGTEECATLPCSALCLCLKHQKKTRSRQPPMFLASVRQALRLTRSCQVPLLLLQHLPLWCTLRAVQSLQQAWLQCCPQAGPPVPRSLRAQTIMHLWDLTRERPAEPTSSTAVPRGAELHEKTKELKLKLACKKPKQDRIQRILQEAELAA